MHTVLPPFVPSTTEDNGSHMPHQKLYPTSDTIHSSQADFMHLHRMMQNLVSTKLGNQAAGNAANLYLCMMLAFESQGVLRVAHVPNLWIDVDGIEYEIALPGDDVDEAEDGIKTLTKTSHGTRGDTPASTNTTHFLRTIESLGISHLPAAQPHTDVLQLSAVRTTGSRTQSGLATTDHMSVDSLSPPLMGEETLYDSLVRLSALDHKSLHLSVETNWAYWDVGKAFFAFSKEHPSEKKWSDKNEQARLIGLLAGAGKLKGVEDDLGSLSALKKRLQRGRKFLLLVELFGTQVLNAAPHVSVSRVDCLQLKVLQNAVESAKVE